MPPKKELCRNFLLGSCRYGAQCKYIHAAQTPSKANPFGFSVQNGNQFQYSNPQQQLKPNPFGFGVQNGNQSQHTNLQQQPKPNPFGFGVENGNQSRHTNQPQQNPNPFGFGVQNNSQSRGASDFGSQQNQFKNQWIRSPQTNASGSSASRQPDNQQASHNCTDPESCKRLIVEDLQKERPLWKLSCYGHSTKGLCDIIGDISYEELRTAAYDDAKRGLSLLAIVERERNLVNSKLVEFNNLVPNPGPLNSAIGLQSPFGGNIQNSPVTAQSSNPPSFSSFSQLSTPFTGGASAPPNNLFGQPHSLQSTSQTSSIFPMSNSPFVNSGFPGQSSSQTIQIPFASSSTGFSNNSMMAKPNQLFSSTASSQISSSSDLFKGSYSTPSSGGLALENISLKLDTPEENLDGDDSIWMKDWSAGEIPESAPPQKYCR